MASMSASRPTKEVSRARRLPRGGRSGVVRGRPGTRPRQWWRAAGRTRAWAGHPRRPHGPGRPPARRSPGRARSRTHRRPADRRAGRRPRVRARPDPPVGATPRAAPSVPAPGPLRAGPPAGGVRSRRPPGPPPCGPRRAGRAAAGTGGVRRAGGCRTGRSVRAATPRPGRGRARRCGGPAGRRGAGSRSRAASAARSGRSARAGPCHRARASSRTTAAFAGSPSASARDALAGQPLEAVHVDVVGRGGEPVAAVHGGDRVRAERPAEPSDQRLQRGRRVGGRVAVTQTSSTRSPAGTTCRPAVRARSAAHAAAPRLRGRACRRCGVPGWCRGCGSARGPLSPVA